MMFYRKTLPAFFLLLLLPFLLRAQSPAGERAWVDSVFNSLSAEEKIAQLMVVRANEPGKDYFPYIEKYISDYNIGGVCFFRNHPTTQARATNRWQAMARTPLLVSMDAEWGLGMRLDSTTVFPYQMTLGAIQDNGLIYQMGAVIAGQCRRLGIHMNFAPVVDINSNPANPVIGVRSFGQDRENVMLKGLAYMQGLQEQGIIATAKHFPGHGDTETDSHKDLPLITHSPERLDSIELYPFRQLIRNGLGGIMIAHLYIPAYEKAENLASTLSPAIVSGLLKDEMGFGGLVVTDALDMKGVTKYHKPGDIEVMALLAGNDILLLPADVPKAIKAIKKSVDDGTLGMAVIDERCRKVLAAKYRAGLHTMKAVETQNLSDDLESPRAKALNRLLYESSATLLRNNDSLVPIARPDTLNIAYVSAGTTAEADHFGNMLSLYAPIEKYSLSGDARPKDVDALIGQLEGHDLVIIGIRNTTIYPYQDYGIPATSWDLIRKLRGKTKVILDLFASPYAIANLGTAELPEAVIVSYQDDPLSQEAGAGIIFGGVAAQGRLPVKVSGHFDIGEGFSTTRCRLGFAEPALLGIAQEYIDRADSIALSGIRLKAYPGCQVLAARDGKIFYNKAFGHQTYDGERSVMITDLYDLASLTKIGATTLALAGMYEQGLMDIDRRLSDYLPYLKNTDKKDIIIRELMAHQSRFRSWIPYFRYTLDIPAQGFPVYSHELSEDYNIRVAEGMYIHRDYYHAILDSIRYSGLRPDGRYLYSDLGFYLIKEAMATVSNMPFEKLVAEKYYRPMGLPTMGYLPLKRFSPDVIAPTEDDRTFRKQILRGDVHDQGAAMLGGVSGHAGLFSNAFDMAVIMQLYLDGGVYGGRRYLERETIEEFTTTQFPLNDNRRGIGFDKPLLDYHEDGPTCRSASHDSFGHSGFTGTYAWADPANGLIYIFLSNRVCPDAGNSRLMEYDIRTNLHQVFYDALEDLAKP